MCEFCNAQPDFRIDWNCAGCRARMLAACPDKRTRQLWLFRWREKGEGAMVDAVKAKLMEMADAQD